MRRAGWAAMTLLALLVALYAVTSATVPGFRTPFVSDLFAEKALRAFGHLGAGGLAIAVGAFQFSTRLRSRRVVVHRRLGTTYVVAVLVSGVSALLLAPSSTGGLPAHWGFGLLAGLWLATTVIAWLAVRRRDLPAHRRWMIRSYALCLAAVTLRIYLPLSQVAGMPFEAAYPAIAWLCWVPNLVIAEWIVIGSLVAPLAPSAPGGSPG